MVVKPDPNELVTLDAQIVRMNENDKKLVSDMLAKLEDQRILITQRNAVIEAVQRNFSILKTMCDNLQQENHHVHSLNA